MGYRKPNAQGFKELSKKLGVSESEMMFIGDESKDIIGANNTGMLSVLINRENEEVNYGQKNTIKTLAELLDIA